MPMKSSQKPAFGEFSEYCVKMYYRFYQLYATIIHVWDKKERMPLFCTYSGIFCPLGFVRIKNHFDKNRKGAYIYATAERSNY